MKNIKINLLSKYNIIIPFTLACALQVSSAIADNVDYDLSKNWLFGINAIYSKTGFKINYGENIFSTKPALGLNPFVRQMFNSNWGIEAGCETYKSLKKTITIQEGNIVMGVLIPVGIRFVSYRTMIKHSHAYLGGIGKINFLEDKNSLNLMLGMSLSNLNARYQVFDSGLPGTVPITHTFKQSKLIPIIKATFEHKLNSNFSVQALTVWKGMSAFKVKSKENPNAPIEIRLKNSLGLGLGITYNI